MIAPQKKGCCKFGEVPNKEGRMCGICISEENDASFMDHRGIEKKSHYIPEIKKFLHFTRLPIQTEFGDPWISPISLGNGSYFLFNGEIFNYPKRCYSSDVDYLRTSIYYDLWKKECKTWDGFWSIAIIEPEKTRITAFTDPLSKKQLYYNENFDISSEIEGLKTKNSKIDYTYFSIVRKFGYNTDNRTIYSNVKRIMPNCIYTFDLKKRSISIEEGYYSFPNPEKDLYTLLSESVSSRMISKSYPISALISGGLDSSIITYFILKNDLNVKFYTINNSVDSEYVEQFSKDFGFSYTGIDYDIRDIPDSEIINIYRKMESPIDLGSVIPQYKLFEKIEDKIVLTGDGADELFGGYRRINSYDSQLSDVFQELPFYHLPRLDRSSMAFTIECRNPFLSHEIIGKALHLPYSERINKKILKDIFRGELPDYIIDREKIPLKNDKIIRDKILYRYKICDLFLKELENENL